MTLSASGVAFVAAGRKHFAVARLLGIAASFQVLRFVTVLIGMNRVLMSGRDVAMATGADNFPATVRIGARGIANHADVGAILGHYAVTTTMTDDAAGTVDILRYKGAGN